VGGWLGSPACVAGFSASLPTSRGVTGVRLGSDVNLPPAVDPGEGPAVRLKSALLPAGAPPAGRGRARDMGLFVDQPG
jgi:hypothetical protein